MIAREGKLAEVDWMTAVSKAGAELAEFKQKHGGTGFGAVVSPHLTNEDNYCFGRMLTGFGASRFAMAVELGKSDDLLIKAEKAPNARGVREFGLVSGTDDGLEALLSAIEAGQIKGLYVCGSDILRTVPRERLSAAIAKLELLIVQDLQLDPAFAGAKAFFPTTTFAEKDGTFTNHAGRVQRIQRALDTPPGWLEDGEIFTRLSNLVESRQDQFELAQIWTAIESDGSSFEGVRFDQLGTAGTQLGGAVAAK
jgi:predicted molibdopterin-dependent oxidoreductase YjgC